MSKKNSDAESRRAHLYTLQGMCVLRKQHNYRFHNPNTAEVTADYILKVFIEVNAKKVERVMQEVAGRSLEEDKQEEK